MKRNFYLVLIPFLLFTFLNCSTAQVYLEKYSSGHVDISAWYKKGKDKIVFGPCFSYGKDQEDITIHVPIIKDKYSYEEVLIKHSSDSIKLAKGTIELYLSKKKIVIDLYVVKNGKMIPLVINGKHKLIIEELKNFRDAELQNPDKCIFTNTQHKDK